MVQIRAEMTQRVQGLTEENERLQGVLQQSSVKAVSMTKKVDELQQKAQAAQMEVQELKSQVNNAMADKNVVGLTKLLELSPNSMKRVVNASKRGSLTSSTVEAPKYQLTVNGTTYLVFYTGLPPL